MGKHTSSRAAEDGLQAKARQRAIPLQLLSQGNKALGLLFGRKAHAAAQQMPSLLTACMHTRSCA